MKKLLTTALLLTALCALSACNSDCKADNCDDEVYENGYCQYHYVMNAAQEELDEIGKDVFDDLLGN